MYHFAALSRLAGIRLACKRLIDMPPFAGREVSQEQYENDVACNPPYGKHEYAFFRIGRGRVRRFKVPSKEKSLCGNVERLLDAVHDAADKLGRFYKAGEALNSSTFAFDRFADTCIEIGVLAALVGVDVEWRNQTKPRNPGRKLEDSQSRNAATKEIMRQLQSGVSWTAATDRAAVCLSANKIPCSGKTLRKKFKHLRPLKRRNN